MGARIAPEKMLLIAGIVYVLTLDRNAVETVLELSLTFFVTSATRQFVTHKGVFFLSSIADNAQISNILTNSKVGVY